MKRKTIYWILGIALAGLAIGGGYGLYLFNMPYRDVQSVESFAELAADDLVNEFLADFEASNEKYLSDEGDSKVLIVTGHVKRVETDQKGQAVVTLSSGKAPATVRCSFLLTTTPEVKGLKLGDVARIKGVIRSGASKDEDLGLFEDVVLEKCAIVPIGS